MKEQKYHIYLTEQERSEVIKSLIDLKNTLIRQGKYTDAVDDVLLKLTGAHLLYVLDCVRENTTDVRHVKPYLLTALYYAPLTMDNHYALMVGHDLSGGSG